MLSRDKGKRGHKRKKERIGRRIKETRNIALLHREREQNVDRDTHFVTNASLTVRM
jgi:hypothetical protein